jgi:hypothetical protein
LAGSRQLRRCGGLFADRAGLAKQNQRSLTGASAPAQFLPSPVANLIDARYRQASRFGELLTVDALLEFLAD